MDKINYFDGDYTKEVSKEWFEENFKFTYAVQYEGIDLIRNDGVTLFIDYTSGYTKIYENVHGTWLYQRKN